MFLIDGNIWVSWISSTFKYTFKKIQPTYNPKEFMGLGNY